MKTSLFALPLPLSLLLFTSTPSTLAYPIPDPNPDPAPIPSDPILLESYLDFNHERPSSPLLSLTIPPSSLKKRAHISPSQQNPLLNTDTPPPNPSSTCHPPVLASSSLRDLLAALTSNILRDHPNGIAFPYSVATHSSTGVEIASSTPLPSEIFSASLELSLTPGAKGVQGLRREHLAALLERVEGSVGGEMDGGGVLGSKTVLIEGVSGGVRFEARWVVYDLGTGRVCGA